MSKRHKIQRRIPDVGKRRNVKMVEYSDSFLPERIPGERQKRFYFWRKSEIVDGDQQYRDTTQIVSLQFPNSDFHRKRIGQILHHFIKQFPQFSRIVREYDGKKWAGQIPSAGPSGELAVTLGNGRKEFIQFWNKNPYAPPGCKFIQLVKGVAGNGSHIMNRSTKFDKKDSQNSDRPNVSECRNDKCSCHKFA